MDKLDLRLLHQKGLQIDLLGQALNLSCDLGTCTCKVRDAFSGVQEWKLARIHEVIILEAHLPLELIAADVGQVTEAIQVPRVVLEEEVELLGFRFS